MPSFAKRLRDAANAIARSRLLRSAVPACSPLKAKHKDGLAHEFLHELPVVLVLVASATLLHHYHVFHGLTAQTMRLVHNAEKGHLLPWGWGYEWARKQLEEPPADQPQVTLLRFSPKGFRAQFCGLSPVPRAALAEAIDHLARGLPANFVPRPVVGIDIDITSLQNSPGQEVEKACPRLERKADPTSANADADHRMVAAIEALSAKAEVVAVAFPRTGPKAREARNTSMHQLCKAGARFASATVFLDPGEPFYRFLNHRKPEAKAQPSTDGRGIPPVFPSLGNLMSVASQPPGGMTADEAERRRLSLEALCSAVAVAVANAPDAILIPLGDPAPEPERGSHFDTSPSAQPYSPQHLYDWDYLDLLRGNARIRSVEVHAIDALPGEVEASLAGTAAPMLLLAIDDGYTDRHYTVEDRVSHTSGDYVHALAALSQRDPLTVLLSRNALLDVLFGCLYLGLWVPIRRGLYRGSNVHGYPSTAGLGLALVPALLASGLALIAIWVSAWALRRPWWLDPLLVLLGLMVHTYLTLVAERAWAPVSAAAHAGKEVTSYEQPNGSGRKTVGPPPAAAPRRPLDRHLACLGSLALRITGTIVVLWAFALIAIELACSLGGH